MHFPEIEQQFGALWAHLCQTRARQMTGQAYLLIGDNIAFLEKFALAWCQVAACQSPAEDGTPCGTCPCCTAFQHNAYPDCHIVRPQSKSRRITVDDMREFEHELSLTGHPGFLKIGMLVEADRLNDASQNAFLKTLEEPPPETMLLLLTTNPRLLLPTTKSRCQILSLRQNRQNYEQVAKEGLFRYLAMLYPHAGAANAIAAAAGITEILQAQRDNAENSVGPLDTSMLTGTDDTALRKQLEEEHISRIEAEYLRLRGEITDAMQVWFLQMLLLAKGIPQKEAPHPEILEGLTLHIPSPKEAKRSISLIDTFLRAIAANVDEKLALDALCLQITEKR